MRIPDKQRLGTFLLGGAVGALAGILLAPRSGRETRGSISNRAGEARERSREAYFDAQERVREHVSKGRDSFDQRPEERAEEESVGAEAEAHEASPDREKLMQKIRETRARLRPQLGDGEDDGGQG